MQSMEEMLKIKSGKNIESGETSSKAEKSAERVTKEELHKTMSGKNITDSALASKVETPSESVTKEAVDKIRRGKNIAGSEITRKVESPAEPMTEEDVFRFLRDRNKDDAKVVELYGRQKDEAGSTNHPKLYRAAMEGNWKAAKAIFDNDRKAKTRKISNLGMTALHVAASCGQSKFVVELVKTLSEEQLEDRDTLGCTALHHVALAADVGAAKAMVEQNSDLPNLGDPYLLTPLYYAAKWRHPSDGKKMVDYLHQVTEDKEPCLPFTGYSSADLIVAIISSGSYDTALRTLKKYPRLAFQRNHEKMSILRVLAMQPLAFRNGHKLSLWKSLIYTLVQVDAEETKHKNFHSPADVAKSTAVSFFLFLSKFSKGVRELSEIKKGHLHALRLVDFVCEEIEEKRYNSVQEYFFPNDNTPILHLATEHGVFRLVQECLNRFPDLIWYADQTTKRLLLHEAIEHRRVEIFNLMVTLIGKNTKAYAHLNDEGENNCLHLAAKLAPMPQLHSVPGPAFQMQRELQWFEAVEAIVYYELRTKKNSDEKTPGELFFDEHKDLLKDAKEWMKDTSNSCMVVATLVATVAFAAMITVPGGNDSETGMPILARKRLFAAFSIANALSMICSAVSLLRFLSIQTSRNTVEDFLEALPKTLVNGLIFLSIAVVTMMISFGTAIGLSLESRLNWAYIPITIVACFPAIIFIRLHLPLLLRTVLFRYGPGIFAEQRNGKLWCLRKIGYRLLAEDMA
ncbi:uncharacterized protein LOC113750349 [Coffea eugenioides]|uniref:uncharacterized protein LOC113750349 n=1 Tax=Coffea eugenioides TaxID=49369 RepID=UPI000F60809B|nr:uncharacterized protein LOC113750349 [Coffea eugenioides]